MPSDEDLKLITLLSQDKFIELDIIATDCKITAYLDAVTTDNKILERIQQIMSNDVQYKEGRVLVPDNDDI